VQSPPVKRLSWAVADEIVAMAASAAEEAVWWTFCKHYRDDAAAAALWEKRDTNLDISPDNSSGLLDGDIDTLLQTAFAEKIGPIDNLPEGYCLACRIFTVVEEFKQRRRIIAWTRATNAEERRILGAMKAAHFIVPFPRVGTLRRRALYRTWTLRSSSNNLNSLPANATPSYTKVRFTSWQPSRPAQWDPHFSRKFCCEPWCVCRSVNARQGAWLFSTP